MGGPASAPAADDAEVIPPESNRIPEPAWPDEAAESAMVSELRARGEMSVAPAAGGDQEPEEDAEPGTLPPLDSLVQKIPADVREALEDLFRARFVTVKRVPKKALK